MPAGCSLTQRFFPKLNSSENQHAMNKSQRKVQSLPQQPPLFLGEKEIQDPYQVITDIFRFASLEELRVMLWSSLKANATGTFATELTAMEKLDVFYLYEKLGKMVEACYLIQKRGMEAEEPGSIVREMVQGYSTRQAKLTQY
jgi:hypothetical protein